MRRSGCLPRSGPASKLLYGYMLEGFGRQQGARRFGEKTTANLRYLEQLVRIFPNCKIIHIVRNPHATVASRLKVPWTSSDVVTNALKWRLEVSCGWLFANRRDLAHGRFLEVRYEDLVTQPEPTLHRVCEFVDENYYERMLNYHRSASAYVEREPWKSGTKRPVYTSSLEGWRADLSESRIFLIDLLARREMNHYGYPQCEVSPRSVLLSPWQIARELILWFDYKRTERRQRKIEDVIVYGDHRKLLHILWRDLSARVFTCMTHTLVGRTRAP